MYLGCKVENMRPRPSDDDEDEKPNPSGLTWRTGQLLKAVGITDPLVKHEVGKRGVNTRGFSALRTTFMTMAIVNGVKPDLLLKVTGHAGLAVVSKFYCMPSAEDISKELEKMGDVFHDETGSTSGSA